MPKDLRLLRLVKRSSTTLDELEMLASSFNEQPFVSQILNLSTYGKLLCERYSDTYDRQICTNYTNFSSFLRHIYLSMDDLLDEERARKARGILGGLRLDVDLVVERCLEIELRPIEIDPSILQRQVVPTADNIAHIQDISSSVREIESVVNDEIKNKASMIEDKSRQSVVYEYVNEVKHSVNTFNVSISIGDGIDIAVLERVFVQVKSITDGFSKRLKSWKGAVFDSIRHSVTKVKKPINSLAQSLRGLVSASTMSNSKDQGYEDDSDTDLDDIGELPGMTLRMARYKLERSVSDISSRTRIQERFIDALENDNYEQFSSVVYVIGFLKVYCREIGVDYRPFIKSARKNYFDRENIP